jgi:hypothetical protein
MKGVLGLCNAIKCKLPASYQVVTNRIKKIEYSIESRYIQTNEHINHINNRLDDINRRLNEIFNQTQYPLRIIAANQPEILGAMRLLRPYKIVGFKEIRMGRLYDGGYVMVDDFDGIACAFSFGISGDDSWDVGVAEKGIPIYQFDYSIDNAPSSHPLLHFSKKRISSEAASGNATIPELVDKHSKEGHSDIILKMDIESAEWDVIDKCPIEYLKHFKQIVCEFHSLGRLENMDFLTTFKRVFEKINSAFSIVHIHANNWGSIINLANIVIPDVLEITFVNKEYYIVSASDETFPTKLDMPNRADCPDIFLGTFRF